MPKIIALVVLVPGLLLGSPRYQEKTGAADNQLVERVEVVNVEVPVRVTKAGMMVKGLTRDDFVLLENGIQKSITECKVMERVMDPGAVHSQSDRVFVLSFNKISDYTRPLEEGLDYLFRDILRAGDRLLFMAGNHSRQYRIDQNREEILEECRDLLKKQCAREKTVKNRYFGDIKQLIHTFTIKLAGNTFTTSTPETKFLMEYLKIWDNYKQYYLTKNLEDYYQLAGHLNQIKGEKWLLEFYQVQNFPKLKPHSRFMRFIEEKLAYYDANPTTSNGNAFAHLCRQLLRRYQIEMSTDPKTRLKEGLSLFNHLGITVHSFFLPAVKTTVSQHTYLESVSTGVESALQELARTTGGRTYRSGNVAQSLDAAKKMTDVLYLLYFEPADPKAPGKVEIRVRGEGYQTTYDPDFSPDIMEKWAKVSDGIRICNAQFLGRRLGFEIQGVELAETTRRGQVVVTIQGLEDATGLLIFNATRAFTTREGKDSFTLNLGFDQLPAGAYTFTVTVQDLGNQKTRRQTLQAQLK